MLMESFTFKSHWIYCLKHLPLNLTDKLMEAFTLNLTEYEWEQKMIKFTRQVWDKVGSKQRDDAFAYHCFVLTGLKSIWQFQREASICIVKVVSAPPGVL